MPTGLYERKKGIFKHSDETKEKMRLAKLGCIPWNKGIKMPKEICEKISKANKGKRSWNKGLIGYKSGEEHYNWKGGITPRNKLMRGKAKWKKWREEVFKRDDYTCKICSNKSGKKYDGTVRLEPHHLYRIIDLINNNLEKYIYDIRNGITVCYDCHRSIHTKK